MILGKNLSRSCQKSCRTLGKILNDLQDFGSAIVRYWEKVSKDFGEFVLRYYKILVKIL